MNFYTGDKIRTSNKAHKEDIAKLKEHKVKPGTIGEVVDVLVKVKFDDDTEIWLHEDYLDYYEEPSNKKLNPFNDTDAVDFLSGMFGFKK